MSFFTLFRRKEYLYTAIPRAEAGSTNNGYLQYIILGLCVLCTIINVCLTVLPPDSNPHLFPSKTTYPQSKGLSNRREIDALRRPSQFIGLEGVYREYMVKKTTTIYPSVLSPINKDEPQKVYGNDPKSYFHPLVGTISPEDRQVWVSSTVSTILQFRAMDFGMETCELHISIPAANQSLDSPLVLPDYHLELYRLDVAVSLYADTLAYANRPKRLNRFPNVNLEYGLEWGHRFACSMDELLTFELACPISAKPGACDTEWWQDREEPNPTFQSLACLYNRPLIHYGLLRDPTDQEEGSNALPVNSNSNGSVRMMAFLIGHGDGGLA